MEALQARHLQIQLEEQLRCCVKIGEEDLGSNQPRNTLKTLNQRLLNLRPLREVQLIEMSSQEHDSRWINIVLKHCKLDDLLYLDCMSEACTTPEFNETTEAPYRF